ncbi:hypothetical protein [Burkholderia ubonensis]|uniref:hypothetical protein n=1 Tax=Burkholderia ubonensis TaxID=101571 RepID=UPI0015A5718F|nr:hypothetical protein [Burkholderia ubonensis]
MGMHMTPEQIAGLLAAKDNLGVSGLMRALQRGHAGAIEAFGKLLAQFESRLSPDQIADLLAAKDEYGTPGLELFGTPGLELARISVAGMRRLRFFGTRIWG